MPTLRVSLIVPTIAVLAGCAPGDPAPEGDGDPDDIQGPLLVSAAASLTDAFAAVADAFVAEHPGVEVRLNLAGSTTLAAQILEGAPVDVFASADSATMAALRAAGATAGEPVNFAGNVLRIAVPPGNPLGLTGLGDFARDELLLGLCAPEVPCGRFADQALARAGVEARPDTREPDVRALLTKVILGELDAGIVYASDVLVAGEEVDGVAIPEGENVTASYPVAALADAPHPEAARAFVIFLRSERAREILRAHGFLSG